MDNLRFRAYGVRMTARDMDETGPHQGLRSFAFHSLCAMYQPCDVLDLCTEHRAMLLVSHLTVNYLIILARPLFSLAHLSFNILTLSKKRSSLSNCPVLSTMKMK